jgi:hypothetical protein
VSKAVLGAAELAGAAGLLAADIFATGGIGLFSTPWLATLWGSLAVGGVTMEAGAIADALTSNRGMNITTRQPAAFRQIIYGEQRVGGVMVYESTTGSHKDQYNMVIVLAAHEIDSIVNLYLDGRQVYWTGSGVGNTTRNGVNFGGNADSANHVGPGGQTYNFGGLVYCEARFGDQASGDVIGGLTANDPNWAQTSAGMPYLGGCAYVYLKIEHDAAQFPQFPEIKFTVRGKNNIWDPRKPAGPPLPTTLQRPSTSLNGWTNNAHVGPYEEGVDQALNWGLNNDTTYPYSNPGNAVDGSSSTAASCLFQHTHKYAGCIWTFPANTGGTPVALWLNALSEVQPINGAARSAGIWYSLDGGTTWTMLCNDALKTKGWNSIQLANTQDWSQVQVMAFMDSHDDMDHYVYDIQLSDGSQQAYAAQQQTGYTTNWALIVADVLRDSIWGLGDPYINEAQLIAAANICDEQVALAAGGTESRYCCHYHFDTSMGPGDVLQTMMPAAAGRLSYIGGEWYIWPAVWQGSGFTFTASDLTGPTQWKPFRKQRDLFNRVSGTYIAPNYPYNAAGDLYDTNGWYNGTIQNNFPFAFQPTNYPEYAADQLHGYATDIFLTQDGGRFLPKELVQNCCLSVTQAQRCAKIVLFRNRQQGSGSLPMGLAAWKMQPLDVMTITFSGQGWTNKVLEVVGTGFTVDRNGDDTVPSVRFVAQVRETDQTVYEWGTSEELTVYDVPSNPGVGPTYSVGAPSGLTLLSNSTTALTQADGSVTPRILATWTAPADSLVVSITIQYQKSGDTSWTDAGSVSGTSTSAYIGNVIGGDTYNVRIQAVRSSGAVSAWVETDGCVVSGANSVGTVFQINGA